MNSIFIRIYGGMLASMLLVSIISYLLISNDNARFNESYHEPFVRGSLYLLSQGLSNYQHHQRSDWFERLAQEMGVEVQIQSVASAMVNPQQLALLFKGEVVLNNHHDKAFVEAWSRVSSENRFLIYVKFKNFSEQQIKGIFGLVLDHLQRLPQNRWEIELQYLQQLFELALKRKSQGFLQQSNWPEDKIVQLIQGKVVGYLNNPAENQSTFSLAASLRPPRVTVTVGSSMNSGVTGPTSENLLAREGLPPREILVMGPLALSNVLPYQLFLIYGAVAIVIMALVSYFLVRPLLFRVRRLQETVVKIRRHDLSARVSVDHHDALGSLAATFNDMAEHIQRLIHSQREMTNAVSHELRTPVARIRFGLEFLEDENSRDQRIKRIREIDDDIQELEQLIDEILTYASLEEGTPSLNLQMIKIDDVLSQVKEECESLGSSIKVEHILSNSSSEQQHAECEERYIHRVVQNLVTNALKYADSKVVVSSSTGAGMIRIDVEDDGPGIPPDKWEKVFVPFARLDDSRTRASGGYGLGLSIVQRILYWHGGLASVSRSQTLGGAKFTMIWPIRQSLRKALQETSSRTATKKKWFGLFSSHQVNS